MKTEIDVKDEQEAEHIRAGLSDPETRAFLIVVGILLPLSDRARRRTMFFVADRLDEDHEARTT